MFAKRFAYHDIILNASVQVALVIIASRFYCSCPHRQLGRSGVSHVHIGLNRQCERYVTVYGVRLRCLMICARRYAVLAFASAQTNSLAPNVQTSFFASRTGVIVRHRNVINNSWNCMCLTQGLDTSGMHLDLETFQVSGRLFFFSLFFATEIFT